MRKIILAAAALATLAPVAASAQPYGRGWGHPGPRYGHYDREYREELRECRRELRRAQTRREYRRELRECRRELRREARDDWRDRDDWRYRDRSRWGHGDNCRARYWDGYRWRCRW